MFCFLFVWYLAADAEQWSTGDADSKWTSTRTSVRRPNIGGPTTSQHRDGWLVTQTQIQCILYNNSSPLISQDLFCVFMITFQGAKELIFILWYTLLYVFISLKKRFSPFKPAHSTQFIKASRHF